MIVINMKINEPWFDIKKKYETFEVWLNRRNLEVL